jgi:cytochrome c556
VAKYPDVDPAHEALLLREHFTELLRTPEVTKSSPRYRQLFEESEKDGLALEEALRKVPADQRAESAAIRDSFERINKNCAACHKEFRDIPLKEKKAP